MRTPTATSNPAPMASQCYITTSRTRSWTHYTHLSELGVPKTPWKYGVLNNCSDDAREEIGALLKHFKHPLDTRRKDDNRCRAQKCFTGEA